MSEYIHRSKSKTGLFVKLYAYGLDLLWATVTSSVKSKLLSVCKITLNFMRNELSHIVGVGFIMFKAIKVILYTVLLSTVLP